MKKINNKGITLVELIVSFVLVTVAVIYFYQTLFTVKKLYTKTTTETKEYVDREYALRLAEAYVEKHNNFTEGKCPNLLNKCSFTGDKISSGGYEIEFVAAGEKRDASLYKCVKLTNGSDACSIKRFDIKYTSNPLLAADSDNDPTGGAGNPPIDPPIDPPVNPTYPSYAVGDKLCIGTECFCAIKESGTDSSTVTALAEWNLLVGYNGASKIDLNTPGYAIQKAGLRGPLAAISDKEGTIAFSNTNFWDNGGSYPSFVFPSDKTNSIYNTVDTLPYYLKKYEIELQKTEGSVKANLITKNDLESLGCKWEKQGLIGGQNCEGAPDWIKSRSFWSGTAIDSENIVGVARTLDGKANFIEFKYSFNNNFGLRPLIEVTKTNKVVKNGVCGKN